MALHDSAFGRVIGVLVSPEKTFLSIAERPTWAVPLLLMALFTLGFGWIAQHRVNQVEMVKYQMDKLGIELDKAQMEKIESDAANSSQAKQLVGLGFGAVAVAVTYLVIAALFLVVFKLAGSEVDFGRSLSTTLHGFLPAGVVAALLNLVIAFPRATISPEEMTTGLLASSLRPLAPEDAPVLQSLLGSVDFFAIWSAVLLILGFRTVAKVSTRTSATVVLVLWGLWVLGKAGFVAVFN